MLDTVKDAFEMLKEEQEEFGQCDVEIDGMTSATALVMFRIRNLSIAPSKGSLQIIMQLRKSLQRSNTVKLFCYLISRLITCGTLFAQGFAKTKQT